MSGTTLDGGALIALERGSKRMIALVERAIAHGSTLTVPTTVIAQAWRDGSRQPRIARLLRSRVTEVVVLDELTARAVGVICGLSGVADVVDVSVAVCARKRGQAVVTSDPVDIGAIDPTLTLLAV